jgi:hypothetical protein
MTQQDNIDNKATRDLAQSVLDLGGYVSEMCDVLEWGDANDLNEPTSNFARASRLSNAYAESESKAQNILDKMYLAG